MKSSLLCTVNVIAMAKADIPWFIALAQPRPHRRAPFAVSAPVGYDKVSTLKFAGRAWLEFVAIGFGTSEESDVTSPWCRAQSMHVPLIALRSLSSNNS